MRVSKLVCIVLMLLLSGCSGADDKTKPDGPLTTGNPPGQTGEKSPPIEQPPNGTPTATFDSSAVWSGCRGFRTSIGDAKAMYDLNPPPQGWEEDDNPVTDFDLRFYECDRVSWGSFERGPVQMILELGTNFLPPDACAGENATLLREVTSWWFNDAEVAQFARDVYGVNSYAAEISVDLSSTGQATDQTWRWGLPGQAQSEVRFADVDLPSQPTTHTTRVLWFVNNTVRAMDFAQEWVVPPASMHGSAFRPAVGRLEPPMVYAAAGYMNDFIGRSERYEGMEIAADFYRFGDLFCEQPL